MAIMYISPTSVLPFSLQPEMSLVLYPLYVHLYLELVYKGLDDEGLFAYDSIY